MRIKRNAQPVKGVAAVFTANGVKRRGADVVRDQLGEGFADPFEARRFREILKRNYDNQLARAGLIGGFWRGIRLLLLGA